MNSPGDIVALVCGSHKRGDKNHVFAKLTELRKQTGFTMLVNGGADYVDTFATLWAMQNKVNFAVEYAKWDFYGNHAGPVRNERLFQKYKPDLVIAFDGDYGTRDAITRAEARNIPVYRV